MKKKLKTIVAIIMCIGLIGGLAACNDTSTPAETPPADNGSAPAESTTPAPTGEVIQWNLGTINQDPSVSTDFNSWGFMCQAFADKVYEYTDGQVEVTVHYAAVLGSGPQMFEQLEMGELDAFSGMPMGSSDPRFGIINVPFLFASQEDFLKALDNGNGEVYKLVEGWISDHNAQLLAMSGGAARGLANSTKEIIAPEDMRGLKMRVYEDQLVQAFWDGLGQTQVLPSADVYSSLQTGNVDAVENHATVVAILKYFEVCKYFTDVDWLRDWTANIMVSDAAWDKLNADQQAAVKKAAWEAVELQVELQNEDIKKAYGFLEENGMTVTQLTPEQRQVWIDYNDTLQDKYKQIVGADIYDDFMAAVEASN